ncbi:hypothetical protein [Ruminococcus albus]|uniref:Uncharacterized protein n=1 Tax=Ruminococcus albus TaxID=1264 RepID=A0A1I1P7G8_RUMAL|nr:hypothetical protein [Ruminococcus albus]SFD03598.1 hypothetical protein SAMN02910406_02934 [Ruminococcus albus]
MKKNNCKTIEKIALGMTVLMLAMSAAGCGLTENPENGNSDKDETTTTAAAAEASKAEESAEEKTDDEKTESEDKPAVEESSAEGAVTTLSDDFDAELDAMIASIEAEIPDITVYSGIGGGSATEEKPSEEATTTTTSTEDDKPDANSPVIADLKNEQQFVFDGKTYDNESFTSAGISAPSGWATGASDKQYENSAYPNCFIVEGPSKGAVFTIGDAKKNGKTSFPSLQLYKGLTWGATVSDIKAAYGEPVKEGKTEQYTTTLNDLYYHSANGGLIVFEVSEDWGLITVNSCGIY